jgi:hypothetical protein
MCLYIKSFCLHKEGNDPKDYEDAFAWSEDGKRIAIADGAASGFESRLWSKALAQAYLHEVPDTTEEAVAAWLSRPMENWNNSIHWERLKWYQVEKARHGAFSTLLGITFDQPALEHRLGVSNSAANATADDRVRHNNSWSAIAVGDACLFQIREDGLLCHFPVAYSSDFGVTPPLLSTRSQYNLRSLHELKTQSGSYQVGDLFILATDAVAEWFLRQIESNQKPWQQLTSLDQQSFLTFIQGLREQQEISNDDVTLLLVSVDDQDGTLGLGQSNKSEANPFDDRVLNSNDEDLV